MILIKSILLQYRVAIAGHAVSELLRRPSDLVAARGEKSDGSHRFDRLGGVSSRFATRVVNQQVLQLLNCGLPFSFRLLHWSDRGHDAVRDAHPLFRLGLRILRARLDLNSFERFRCRCNNWFLFSRTFFNDNSSINSIYLYFPLILCFEFKISIEGEHDDCYSNHGTDKNININCTVKIFRPPRVSSTDVVEVVMIVISKTPGGAGILWYVFYFWLVYENPTKHPTISDDERKLILTRQGEAAVVCEVGLWGWPPPV